MSATPDLSALGTAVPIGQINRELKKLWDTGGNAPTPRKSKEQRRAEADERQAKSRIKKEHDAKVASVEMQIAALEARQQQITAELEKSETYEAGGAAMNLNRESLSVSQSLERLTAEWEALSAQNVEG